MSDPITRGELLRRAAVGGSILTVPGLLAACGGGGSAKSTTAAAAAAQTMPKSLTWSNWPLYIDVDKAKKHPSLLAFEKKYSVNVKYVEDVNDNDSFFGKIQGPLSQGQSVGRDVIVMTDASGIPARMIELGWVEKLDKSAIPNAANLLPVQQHPSWDPNREYSLPWQSGMTGIGYDPQKVGYEIDSVDKLLTDPKLKGKITLLTEFGDTIGLVMAANGDDPAKVTQAGFDRAVKKIKKAIDSGQIRQFTGVLRVVGRHGAAPGRPSGAQVGAAEDRFDDLDGQHAHPEGRQRLRGVGADELVLRPGQRREGRGVRELHLPGRGSRQGAREDRPEGGAQPAHLPDEGDAREHAPDRLEGRQRSEAQAGVPEADRCVGRRSLHTRC
jgi:hypothetical protein